MLLRCDPELYRLRVFPQRTPRGSIATGADERIGLLTHEVRANAVPTSRSPRPVVRATVDAAMVLP